ncbi:hypothetical protein C2S53_010369 [Perilla frutescens var. hirtella]|uniref:Structural constituent of ribosome n=1 Tax=Perilla frutescens var. hirtella TaxID=608512 RepID=A0AAD4IZT1_PERFH|nr:hypothetical protein C2S53_010369 [Perilla frutescens var. hirtella]
MALLTSSISANPISLHIFTPKSSTKFPRRFSPSLASLSTPPPPAPPPPSSSSNSSASAASQTSTSPTTTENFTVFGKESSPKAPELPYNYAFTDLNGNSVVRFVQSTESTIERVIFDFRFLALLAVGGSLAGSLLCFLNGCVYIVDAYKVYWTSCVKGIHSGKMVLRLVEAIDVYLAGTVMLIFAMGLYGLFISNVPPNVPPSIDRALKGSSLFGMFALKERPQWMKISSLDELKTKVGHVIVMILLVKMFERSKMVTIATGVDLLSYSVCIFLSSASLYILHNLHKPESH